MKQSSKVFLFFLRALVSVRDTQRERQNIFLRKVKFTALLFKICISPMLLIYVTNGNRKNKWAPVLDINIIRFADSAGIMMSLYQASKQYPNQDNYSPSPGENQLLNTLTRCLFRFQSHFKNKICTKLYNKFKGKFIHFTSSNFKILSSRLILF